MSDRECSTVEVDLAGDGNSRVWIDGVLVRGLRSVKVSQDLDGPPVVTVEIIAEHVTGGRCG